MKLKIVNLSNEISEKELMTVISEFGHVEQVEIQSNPDSSSKYALLKTSEETGEILIKYLNEDIIKGVPVQIFIDQSNDY